MSMVDLKLLEGAPPSPSSKSKRRWNSKSFSDKNLLSPSLLLVSSSPTIGGGGSGGRRKFQFSNDQRKSMLGERLAGIRNEVFPHWNPNDSSSSRMSISSSSSEKSSTSFTAETSSSSSSANSNTNPTQRPLKSCLKKQHPQQGSRTVSSSSLSSSYREKVSSSTSSSSRRRSSTSSRRRQRSSLPKKGVHFSTIHVREHPIILGDNPAVSSGAPIQIDWDAQCDAIHHIDYYELIRLQERRTQRKEFLLPVGVRARMLLTAGYTIHEIAGATVEANACKISRYESATRQDNWERIDFLKNVAGKAFRHLLVHNPKSGKSSSSSSSTTTAATTTASTISSPFSPRLASARSA